MKENSKFLVRKEAKLNDNVRSLGPDTNKRKLSDINIIIYLMTHKIENDEFTVGHHAK